MWDCQESSSLKLPRLSIACFQSAHAYFKKKWWEDLSSLKMKKALQFWLQIHTCFNRFKSTNLNKIKAHNDISRQSIASLDVWEIHLGFQDMIICRQYIYIYCYCYCYFNWKYQNRFHLKHTTHFLLTIVTIFWLYFDLMFVVLNIH